MAGKVIFTKILTYFHNQKEEKGWKYAGDGMKNGCQERIFGTKRVGIS